MLSDFLESNRELLISRCRETFNKRLRQVDTLGYSGTVNYGVPIFLRQLVETLRDEQDTDVRPDHDSKPTQAATELRHAAALHGAELLRRGVTVDQVVHAYGDVCQCVTSLAVEQKTSISSDEFRTLNRCLDNAIADAVTAFSSGRETAIDRQAESLQNRLIFFSEDFQRLIDIAIKSRDAARTSDGDLGGENGASLDHSLTELSSLTERALLEILLASSGTQAIVT